jgi:hypothetical protein
MVRQQAPRRMARSISEEGLNFVGEQRNFSSGVSAQRKPSGVSKPLSGQVLRYSNTNPEGTSCSMSGEIRTNRNL